jgi:LuxR family maltose regulon positive regulatory protein
MSATPVQDSLVEQSRGIAVQAERTASEGAARLGVGLLWCALGAAELAGQDAVSARQSLAAARRQLRDGPREFDDRARAWQALAEAVYGDLVAASDLAAHDAGTDALVTRLCQLAMAHVHLARDEAAAARAALDQCDPDERAAGLGDGDPAAGSVILSLAAVARARLALAEGDTSAARNFLTRLRYRCLNGGQNGPAVLEEFLAPLEADIAVRDGDFSRAKLALGGTESGKAGVRIAEAMLLLAQGDSEGALSTLEPCLAGIAVALHDQVCALVVAAIAERRLGHAEHATDRLTIALGLAEPQRMYQPFLDGGGAARSALTVLIRPVSQGAAFAARVLQRFDTAPAQSQQATAAIPLTSSELAVLRFLPSHMTNQEIAEALFLSINTVKTHLRSVYRKLNVTTRREAIARGGKLGLL